MYTTNLKNAGNTTASAAILPALPLPFFYCPSSYHFLFSCHRFQRMMPAPANARISTTAPMPINTHLIRPPSPQSSPSQPSAGQSPTGSTASQIRSCQRSSSSSASRSHACIKACRPFISTFFQRNWHFSSLHRIVYFLLNAHRHFLSFLPECMRSRRDRRQKQKKSGSPQTPHHAKFIPQSAPPWSQ